MHNPAEVVTKNKIEVIYDQTILTTRPVGANRPDILIKDLENKKAYIIDISCQVDTNCGKKECKKIAKYGALGIEAESMWGVKAQIIPVIVGGLGAVSHIYICLLGSKKILKDVLRRSK